MKSITLIVTLACLISACGTTATITRKRGRPIEAKIVGRTETHLVAVTDAGKKRVIRADDIEDIDHPSVAAVTGGVLTAYGLMNIASGLPKCEQEGAAFCSGVFLPAAVGASLLIWGLRVWTRSTSAVESVSVTPTVSQYEGKTMTGFAVSRGF